MKISLAQLNPIIGDFDGNVIKIRKSIRLAKDTGCDLLVFPELALTGYPPKDLFYKEDFVNRCQSELERIAGDTEGISVLIGAPLLNRERGNSLFNAAVFMSQGEISSLYKKHYLPTYDVFDEDRYFEPGNDILILQMKGQRIGVTICEDLWNDTDFFKRQLYTEDLLEKISAAGIDLMINLAASPYHRGKIEFRYRLLSHVAEKWSWDLLYVNQIGAQDSLIFDGGSAYWNRNGDLLLQASFFQEEFISFEYERGQDGIRNVIFPESLSGEEGFLNREVAPLFRDKPEHYSHSLEKDHLFAKFKNKEFINHMTLGALVLGIHDYLKKIYAHRAVLGLSGGIDSAMVAFLAAQALGAENLYVLLMPSDFSSSGSVNDALEFCRRNGVSHEIISIAPLYELYLESLNRHLKKEEMELAHENIQARIRGNLLMAYSNKSGAILLATSNKSETAVGYATLYGDMAGGLSPIMDVPKTLLYELAECINKTFDGEPIPREILDKAPSAELRPNQKDSDSLPEYEVLDLIIEQYIEKHARPQAIAQLLQSKFYLEEGEAEHLVAETVNKIHRAEYKRKQATIGLKITSKDFSVGRRFPIVHRYRET